MKAISIFLGIYLPYLSVHLHLERVKTKIYEILPLTQFNSFAMEKSRKSSFLASQDEDISKIRISMLNKY